MIDPTRGFLHPENGTDSHLLTIRYPVFWPSLSVPEPCPNNLRQKQFLSTTLSFLKEGPTFTRNMGTVLLVQTWVLTRKNGEEHLTMPDTSWIVTRFFSINLDTLSIYVYTLPTHIHEQTYHMLKVSELRRKKFSQQLQCCCQPVNFLSVWKVEEILVVSR